jgi:hypothetical protein
MDPGDAVSRAEVVAEDLRNLAEVAPFDTFTCDLLHEAADLLDPDSAELWEPTT